MSDADVKVDVHVDVHVDVDADQGLFFYCIMQVGVSILARKT